MGPAHGQKSLSTAQGEHRASHCGSVISKQCWVSLPTLGELDLSPPGQGSPGPTAHCCFFQRQLRICLSVQWSPALQAWRILLLQVPVTSSASGGQQAQAPCGAGIFLRMSRADSLPASQNRAAAGMNNALRATTDCTLTRGQALSGGLCSCHSWPVMLATVQEEKHYPCLMK